MSIKLPFGLQRSDRRLVDVGSVPNGKNCGCVCPSCGGDLVAKKEGKLKIPHFAHAADCETAYETAIHETSKQILRDLGYCWLPASPIARKQKFYFTGHTIEERYDRIVPDIIVWRNESPKLALEIFVTHAVDSEKLAYLRQARLACIEFDLSDLSREITYEGLKASFEQDTMPSRWVYNYRAELADRKLAAERRMQEAEEALQERLYRRKIRAEAIPRPVFRRKNRSGLDVFHIDPCPRAMRNSHGRLIANVKLDCCRCEFCLDIKRMNREPVSIRCAGHLAPEILKKDAGTKAARQQL